MWLRTETQLPHNATRSQHEVAICALRLPKLALREQVGDFAKEPENGSLPQVSWLGFHMGSHRWRASWN